MITNATGIILADDARVYLSELSRPRALAAVPIAGRFRIVDFALSNMMNSGISTVGVSTYNKYKSLMDHLGSGAEWDLDRKNQGGLSILAPYITGETYNQTNGALRGLLDFIQGTKENTIILASSTSLFADNYEALYANHIASGADATVVYNNEGSRGGPVNDILVMDDSGRVVDYLDNPPIPPSDHLCLGVICMAKNCLVDILSNAVAHGETSLTESLILSQCNRYNIRGFYYPGKVLRITSVKTYFQASMAMLDEDMNCSLFWSDDPIHTKVKDESPAFICQGANVKNSIVSDGCWVEGEVKDSILFRNVRVGKGSKISNSIIMQASEIGENVELDHVIIDKKCVIRAGSRLIGQEDFPVVIGKDATI